MNVLVSGVLSSPEMKKLISKAYDARAKVINRFYRQCKLVLSMIFAKYL